MRITTASVSLAEEVILAEYGFEADPQSRSCEEPASGEKLEPGPSSGSSSPGAKLERIAQEVRVVFGSFRKITSRVTNLCERRDL